MRVILIYLIALASFLGMVGASGLFFRELADANQSGDRPTIMVAQKPEEPQNALILQTAYQGRAEK